MRSELSVLYVRVAVLSSVLNPAVGLAAVSYLVGRWRSGRWWRGSSCAGGTRMRPRCRFGSSGVFLSAAVLGLTDVDALTYSMAKVGYGPPGPAAAARGLAVGIVSNTAFKLALAGTLGRGPFRRLAVAGLAALAAAGLVMLLVC